MLSQVVLMKWRHIETAKKVCERLSMSYEYDNLNLTNKFFVIECSSFLEISFAEAINLYAEKRCSPSIKRFVTKKIAYQNTLNCKKIYSILEELNPKLKVAFDSEFSEREREAIDSINAIRNQIAHGGNNGTGHVQLWNYIHPLRDFGNRMFTVLDKKDK